MMIVISCLSQIVALYKSRFTAVNFGASDYMDAYNFSLEIATFLFSFVTTGITTVIIPAYVNKVNEKAINTFITCVYSVVFIISLICIIFRNSISMLFSDRGVNFTNNVSDFLIVTFIIQGITAFLAVTSAYYQCIGYFNIPKIIVLVVNALLMIVLITKDVKDIYEYLLLLVSASGVNLIFDVSVAIKIGFRYKPQLDMNNNEFIHMFKIFLPTLFSSGVYKIHSLVDTTIATDLAEGQTTILGYSSQILSMVNTIIIGNLTVYIYPKIVSNLKCYNGKKIFWDYSILFHSCVLIIIAGFITVGKEGIQLIFGGGNFTNKDVYSLYICSCIYIFGQQFNILRDLIYRYFYANGDTKITFRNSVMVSITNIFLSLVLASFIGLYGIIMGTIISSFLSLIMIMKKYSKIYGFGINIKYIIFEWCKNLGAMIITVITVSVLKKILIFKLEIFNIAIYGFITIIIYIIIMMLFKTRIKYIKL